MDGLLFLSFLAVFFAGLAGGRLLLANRLNAQKTKDLERIIELEKTIAGFEAEKRNLEEKIATHEADLQKLHKSLTDQFENLGHKIFERHTEKFKSDSEKGLADLLLPFKERLKDFALRVERFYGDEAKQRASLKTEIERIVMANEQITQEAKNLTLALKGDSKTQGNWGEFVLQKILEASGLREGEEFTAQGKGMKLTGEEGERLQPDIIIHLPEGKHIIIDSKVSLTAYESYTRAAEGDEKEKELSKFMGSLYAHVGDLAGKKYHHLEQLITPEFVLMFLPMEGAYILAMQKEQELHTHAWSKYIVIVSPTTLLATLRTVESIWKRERQNKHAMEIARRAGALYDKFAAFVTDFEKIGENITKTEKVYQDALNKLKDGKGNLISSAENIRKLGAKASKTIPEKYLLEEGPESESNELPV